jgi:hypothetical protein
MERAMQKWLTPPILFPAFLAVLIIAQAFYRFVL